MPRLSRKNSNSANFKIADKDQKYVVNKCAQYMMNHVERFNFFDQETFQLLCWIMGSEKNKIKNLLCSHIRNREKQNLQKIGPEVAGDLWEDSFEQEIDSYDYYSILARYAQRIQVSKLNLFRTDLASLLQRRIRTLSFRGKSELQKALYRTTKMFSFSKVEVEFLTFLYIATVLEEFNDYLVDHLHCNQLTGKKYILNFLRINNAELTKIKTGTLSKAMAFDVDYRSFCLNCEFLDLLQDGVVSSWYFSKIKPCRKSADFYLIETEITEHLLNLLKTKASSPTHILLYGAPGTGKTTYAKSLVSSLNVPAYEIIMHDYQNKSDNRRAGLIACLNMTNNGEGSIIIVDEADALLNTLGSWFLRGETLDKGWLNNLLEEPGTRIIWIVNHIGLIEESVLRRFAYSLNFEPFNNRQRICVWNNVLKRRRAKGLLSKNEIEYLAKKFRVSPGAVEISVQKALQSRRESSNSFKEVLELTLASHETLLNEGEKVIHREQIEKDYSIDGLNIEGDTKRLMDQLVRFNQYLDKSNTNHRMGFTCLFYGPPGTGKSELGRFIAHKLKRELIVKRASNLLSMYVGESEKMIMQAFAEAEREEAVLVIDEVDSFLYNRNRSVRTWEISLVNEFLTQMEIYQGILICTTNLLYSLDEAAIRRFTHKIGFNFLNSDGNVIFYKKMLSPLLQTKPDRCILSSLDQFTNLTPGDFKVVRDQYSFYPRNEVSHDTLLDALAKESRLKNEHKGQKSIGF